VRSIWKRFNDPVRLPQDYRFEDWLAEWRAVVWSRLKRASVLHALYDDQLDLLLRRRWLVPCPFAVTFHMPADFFQERFGPAHKKKFNGVDAAVVLAKSQLAGFQELLGADRVFYVPHGIDINCFQPKNDFARSGPVRFVSVGNHMRDW